MAYSGIIGTGTSRSGVISPVGEYDSFNTTLIGGLTYSVAAKGASSGNGTLGDPNLWLYDASGNQLRYDDDVQPGVNRDAQITFTHTGYTGTYTLIVGEKGVVSATIRAGVVLVNGEVIGNVFGHERVELRTQVDGEVVG